MTDADLVKAFRNGDQSAFEQLLYRHQGMTKAVAAEYYAVGWAYADLLLEAQVGVWEAALSWNGQHFFHTWARFIAQRKVITLVKVSTRKKAIAMRNSYDLSSPELRQTIESGVIGGLTEDPLDVILHETEARDLNGCLEILNSLTRLEALSVIGKLAGESYEQIAVRTGTSPRSVDNALLRARKKLKHLLPKEKISADH